LIGLLSGEFFFAKIKKLFYNEKVVNNWKSDDDDDNVLFNDFFSLSFNYY
jgi:hypothetical protein